MLINLKLLVMIRSLFKLLNFLNLLQIILPYSMTVTDLHWSRRSLLKTVNTIALNPRLNEWCSFTWPTTLQLSIVLHPKIRMFVLKILNHRLVWMLQWHSSRQASSIPPSEMWRSSIWSVNHKDTGLRKNNPSGCRISSLGTSKDAPESWMMKIIWKKSKTKTICLLVWQCKMKRRMWK